MVMDTTLNDLLVRVKSIEEEIDEDDDMAASQEKSTYRAS
jgi:hypothetical protein